MTWQRYHPKDIPRRRWLDWLSATPAPSPYLLPEWSLFWESVWPHSRAEVWVAPSRGVEVTAAVPLVRRRRFGLEMCYALPNATPSGPMGLAMEAADRLPFGELIELSAGRRTVEFTATPDWFGRHAPRWTGGAQPRLTWILNLAMDGAGDLRSRYSESHLRNIEKGRTQEASVTDVRNDDDVRHMLNAWPARARRSRIVLDRHRAPLFAGLFGSTGAMLWPVAWSGEKPVATFIFLKQGQSAVYVDGAVDRDPRQRGVSHLLFDGILRRLRDDGVESIDLGGGPADADAAGLDRFKQGWGATPHTRHEGVYRRPWYHHLHAWVR